ncbi:MAG: MFS domain-containing histidine kinase [Rubricoccaceae bacterium]|nr:MFS domain-containing histidine kinase [Rubricoccaceae bacterium]
MSWLLHRLIPVPAAEVEAYHQGYLLVAACFLTGLFSVTYAVMDAFAGYWVGTALMAGVGTAFFVLPPLLRRTGSVRLVAHLFLLTGTVTVVVNAQFAGGVEVLPWLAVVPVAGVLLTGRRAGMVWTALAVGLAALFVALEAGGYQYRVSASPAQNPIWVASVRMGLPLIVFLLARIFHQERERALARLNARNDALESALDDLEQTQAQLVQAEKLASLGQLTAGIAHEIKNPLNFILNFSALSVDRVDDLATALQASDNDAAREVLADLRANARRVHEHGARADGIVQAMLAHARQDPGPRERLDLNVLVAERVALAFPPARGEGTPDVVVEARYDGAVGMIEGAREGLGRALQNLLENARHAALSAPSPPEAPVTPRVWVKTTRRDGGVEVRVRDNGSGIPVSLQARIFEPFFTTKPPGEGTGLGLSLAHDIVCHRHGGTLGVESAVGRGAVFVVTMPDAEGSARREGAGSAGAQTEGGRGDAEASGPPQDRTVKERRSSERAWGGAGAMRHDR